MPELFTLTISRTSRTGNLFGETRAAERVQIRHALEKVSALIGDGKTLDGDVQLDSHKVVGFFTYTPIAKA